MSVWRFFTTGWDWSRLQTSWSSVTSQSWRWPGLKLKAQLLSLFVTIPLPGSKAIGFDRLHSWLWSSCCRGMSVYEPVWALTQWPTRTQPQWSQWSTRRATLTVKRRFRRRCLLQEQSPWKRRWLLFTIYQRPYLALISLYNVPLFAIWWWPQPGGYGWGQRCNNHRRGAVQFNRIQAQSGSFQYYFWKWLIIQSLSRRKKTTQVCP